MITIYADFAGGFPQAMADRVQLQQVLMNLMLNGIEATQDASGELSVKSQLADDGQLLISVADTGVGLPAENVIKIFDALFMTKAQGTGLGLSIAVLLLNRMAAAFGSARNPDGGQRLVLPCPVGWL